MRNHASRRNVFLPVCLTLLALGCVELSRLVPAPTSTPLPSPSDTATATLTMTARPSDTPQQTDTPEPSPSLSPTEALSLTLTAWPSVLSSIPTTPAALACQLDWQSPGSGIIYDPGTEFTVGWSVTNTGSDIWDPGSVVFTYVSGAKLHIDPTIHLETTVGPGDSVVLSAQMRAPKISAPYTTHWSLRQGDVFFCPVTVSIYVD